MKFKSGLSKRRMRYATALFQKNDKITMKEVSNSVKAKYGMGMAQGLLTMCKRTADAERSAKAETKQARKDKWKEELRAKHVAKANGAIVEKFEKERKASAWKGSDKALKVEIDWRVAKPQVDGMPPEFYEGLKLVRAALLGTKQVGTVTLINYDERMEVKYELEERIGKTGKFDLNT